MKTFILFHGGWCWDLVTDPPRAARHRVIAPDLPGQEGKPAVAGATLEAYAQFVADLLDELGAARNERSSALPGQ